MRDGGRRAGFIPVALPGADLDAVVRRLDEMGLVGAAVDGHRLGLHDVVVARVVGGEDHAWVLRGPDDEDQTIALDELTRELASRWPGTLVGSDFFDRHAVSDPVLVSTDVPRATVAVTPRADLMLGVFAKATGTTFHEAVVDDRLLVDMTGGSTVVLDGLVDALVNAKGRSVVLWKVGDHVAMHAMRKGHHAAAHVWTSTWTPFGHPDLDDLRDPEITGDAAAFGDVLGLSPERIVDLRAMMRRETPDLVELVGILDLPTTVVDVLDRRITVADLPGAVLAEPRSMRDSLSGSEHDPAWMKSLEEGPRELRPWYLVTSLLTLLLGVFLLIGWLAGGSAFWGVIGLVLTLGTFIDVPVRWRLKRRRAT